MDEKEMNTTNKSGKWHQKNFFELVPARRELEPFWQFAFTVPLQSSQAKYLQFSSNDFYLPCGQKGLVGGKRRKEKNAELQECPTGKKAASKKEGDKKKTGKRVVSLSDKIWCLLF